MIFQKINKINLAYSLEIIADSLQYGSDWNSEKKEVAALYLQEIGNILLAEARSQKIALLIREFHKNTHIVPV